LPKPGVDLRKWAVIAVDQFTSQPEYWEQVEQIVGDAPSTLRLTLPEIFLEQPGEAERIQRIQATTRQYLDTGILQPHEGLIFVERTAGGKTRKGLMLCLDLECYDYHAGSTSLIRATEGTIIERLPPRMKIREGAALELPHILVLIDDPQRTVIEPIGAAKAGLEILYDFDLMLGSGHLTGYAVNDAALEHAVVSALRELARPETFAAQYGVTPIGRYCSSRWAMAITPWRQPKRFGKNQTRDRHEPSARFALVGIENVTTRVGVRAYSPGVVRTG
jgi:hypothetical protein